MPVASFIRAHRNFSVLNKKMRTRVHSTEKIQVLLQLSSILKKSNRPPSVTILYEGKRWIYIMHLIQMWASQAPLH